MIRPAIWTLLFLLLWAPDMPVAQVLVEEGTLMKYLANVSDPGIVGAAWAAEVYAPAGSWTDGWYGVGYESGTGAADLLTTTVPVGAASVYTRTTFEIVDASAVATLFLGVDYDDGYVAWINGVEVSRQEVPQGEPGWDTQAILHESSNGTDPDYTPLQNVSVAGIPALHNGINVLGIGAWNAELPSSDLVLVPQLSMNLSGPDPRGPYLQNVTDTSMTVKWRTSGLQDGQVRYGPAPDDLNMAVDDPTMTFDHEIVVSGLSPDTTYYYSIGSTAATIAGGDPDHYFRTAPLPGSRRPLRIWVLGDSGTANPDAMAVRDAYHSFAGGTPTDLWLMLGDNAYPNGTDEEYQAAVFEIYPEMLRTTALFATLGNHDGLSSFSADLSGPFYEIFTLPTGGSASGVPSGTESYYSFDFGNIHFVCLNSYDEDRSPTGSMLTWLEQDLMNTTRDWIIAFWHHPPYTDGSLNSDDSGASGGRLRDMREDALPILEDWGVDLVLTGHSHSYQRSILLDGHYDISSTLLPAMKLDEGDGWIEGDGAYQKASAGPAAHQGAVYVVAGSSGKISGDDPDHPVMHISLNSLGSLVLDVEGDRLTGTFLDDAAVHQDHFNIVKNTSTPPVADFGASPLAGTVPLSVTFQDLSSTNTAAWDWDLDGDSVVDSDVPSPSRTYTTPGAFAVELTASNAGGADTLQKTAYVCVSALAPGVVTGTAMPEGGTTIAWVPASGAAGYDVVKGDVLALRAGEGDFSAASLSCLESASVDLTASDLDAPAPGGGFFYLVRSFSDCAHPGTFDSGGPGQSLPRDPGIAAAPAHCP